MPTYLELDVALRDIKPKIYRRLHLRPDLTFLDLHEAIRDAGPWEDDHLWEFRTPGRRGRTLAAPPGGEPDALTGVPPPDAAKVRLGDFFDEKGKKCDYLYDFGDGWEHEVKLRKTIELDDAFVRRLIDGARAFPPEDCGGAWGYYACLHAAGEIEWDGDPVERPDDAETEARRRWLGDWRPDGFDLEAARRAFDRPKPPRRRKRDA